MRIRTVILCSALSFAAGGLLAMTAGHGPTFAVLVRGADGAPQFLLDEKPRPDFVYVGFPAAPGTAQAAPKLVLTPPGQEGTQPTLACPNPKDTHCQHVAAASQPRGGTIICEPGECNPPTGVNLPNSPERIRLTVTARPIDGEYTQATVQAVLHQ